MKVTFANEFYTKTACSQALGYQVIPRNPWQPQDEKHIRRGLWSASDIIFGVWVIGYGSTHDEAVSELLREANENFQDWKEFGEYFGYFEKVA